jgi:eukaryotic-like serine/threonine-protein kinase
LPRLDALKVLSAELSRDPTSGPRFVREADVAAALDHPQIVSVYNRGETGYGQLWIVMQFVDGTDADDALRAGTMTARPAVHIISEVAKALDFAHTHNVVHRDVKPANFLLSGPADESERVLLGDFGIARALDDVGLTATGSVMATLAYAAPEGLSGMAFDLHAAGGQRHHDDGDQDDRQGATQADAGLGMEPVAVRLPAGGPHPGWPGGGM